MNFIKNRPFCATNIPYWITKVEALETLSFVRLDYIHAKMVPKSPILRTKCEFAYLTSVLGPKVGQKWTSSIDFTRFMQHFSAVYISILSLTPPAHCFHLSSFFSDKVAFQKEKKRKDKTEINDKISLKYLKNSKLKLSLLSLLSFLTKKNQNKNPLQNLRHDPRGPVHELPVATILRR